MRNLYLDCFAGISGNMFIGAMLDLGVDSDYLINELKKLGLEGYDLIIKKVNKLGITATYFNVITEEFYEYNHVHRNLYDIEELIDESLLSDEVKKISKDIFMKVAIAESKIHGVGFEKLHFHEVGAIDSIIDIVGAVICLDYLKIDKVYASAVHVGNGFVNCAHGDMPIPAPATLEILKNDSIPFYRKDIDEELTTPTGAAILSSIVDEFRTEFVFVAEEIGYGAGKRELNIPNILRTVIGNVKKN